MRRAIIIGIGASVLGFASMCAPRTPAPKLAPVVASSAVTTSVCCRYEGTSCAHWSSVGCGVDAHN